MWVKRRWGVASVNVFTPILARPMSVSLAQWLDATAALHVDDCRSGINAVRGASSRRILDWAPRTDEQFHWEIDLCRMWKVAHRQWPFVSPAEGLPDTCSGQRKWFAGNRTE
jgi:hypothetical protein